MKQCFIILRGGYFAILLLAIVSCGAKGVDGVEISSVGDMAIWKGPILRSNVDALETILNQGGFKKLRLENSPGGDGNGMFALKNIVRSRQLIVVARGQCASACALIFIGAGEREVADRDTYFHIHGSYEAGTGKFQNFLKPEELELLDKNTGGRFPRSLYAEARMSPVPKGGLYIYARGLNTETSAEAFMCSGAESMIPLGCRPLAGVTLVTLGLLSDQVR